MKTLDIKDIHFTIEVEQDDIPVRGNAIASGDDIFDCKVENEIIQRLDNGDVWAWASVKVIGTYKGLSSCEYIGACSYENEAEFKADGYYDDICYDILCKLNAKLSDIIQDRCVETRTSL
jgi:hypothetical protein